jgi:RimJ/RimL family protein N-acetyltransferase
VIGQGAERFDEIRLVTERLVLRAPVASLDAGPAAGMLGDPEVMRFLGGEVVPVAHHAAVVARWRARWEHNGMGTFVATRRDDECFVGRAGILVWDTRTWAQSTLADAGEHAQAELGWALVRAHWDKGYATEAARAVRDWAYADRGVRDLVSVIAPDNLRSQRVADRLGAVPAETVQLADAGPAVVWRHPSPRWRERAPADGPCSPCPNRG